MADPPHSLLYPMSPIAALLIFGLALIAADFGRVAITALVGLNAPAATTNQDLDLIERQARLRTIIDIACASPGMPEKMCGWLYVRCRDDMRALELWESLDKASQPPYDPWATTPTAHDLQHRVKLWLKHPGFPSNC